MFGFPLWWAFVNPLMPITFAVLVFRLRPMLTGWRVLGVVILAPMADAIANASAGWPVWLSLNSGKGYAVTYLGGTATILLALCALHLLTLLVPREKRLPLPAALPRHDHELSPA